MKESKKTLFSYIIFLDKLISKMITFDEQKMKGGEKGRNVNEETKSFYHN